jgi:protein subunit release factor A
MILNSNDLKLDILDRPVKGGQHAPAASYGVKATHLPTKLEAVCTCERSSHRNREICLAMLQAGLDRMESLNR